jgi:hypothetical protein
MAKEEVLVQTFYLFILFLIYQSSVKFFQYFSIFEKKYIYSIHETHVVDIFALAVFLSLFH